MTKKRRNGNGKRQLELRPWGDLPNELLVNILNRIDTRELFWIISLVSRSWQLASWDVLFWKTDVLDLRCLTHVCLSDIMNVEVDRRMEVAIERVMRTIFDYHCDDGMEVRRDSYSLKLPRIRLEDRHLVSISKRTPKIDEILLIMCEITGKGFSRTIRNWRELVVISLDSISRPHYPHIIQELGINCAQLKVLTISSIVARYQDWFHFDEYNAQVIGNSLPGLRIFNLEDCYIYELGLLTFMSKCRKVFSVKLGSCARVLEESRGRRSRSSSDEPRLRLIEEPLSVKLEAGEDGEWFIETLEGTLAGVFNMASVVHRLWM